MQSMSIFLSFVHYDLYIELPCRLRNSLKVWLILKTAPINALFGSERVLIEHKETCLKINGRQTAKLTSGSIKFKNHFKQLAVSFKIYAGLESVLKGVKGSNRNNNTSYSEKYQKHIPCSFAYRVVCMINLVKQLFYVWEKVQSIDSWRVWLLQKSNKSHFNKNLVLSAED